MPTSYYIFSVVADTLNHPHPCIITPIEGNWLKCQTETHNFLVASSCGDVFIIGGYSNLEFVSWKTWNIRKGCGRPSSRILENMLTALAHRLWVTICLTQGLPRVTSHIPTLQVNQLSTFCKNNRSIMIIFIDLFFTHLPSPLAVTRTGWLCNHCVAFTPWSPSSTWL